MALSHYRLPADPTPVQRLAYWIKEREWIRRQKDEKYPLPWTEDPILRSYRFCNVHREDDRVTRWIKRNWRTPYAKDKNLWHAMVIARFINWPDTLEVIGYPEPWAAEHVNVSNKLRERSASGAKVFTGAYIVSTNGATMDKVSYVLGLFERAWNIQRLPVPGDSLAAAHEKLMEVNGIGSFMAAQILADLKNTPFLRNAPDWFTWAAPGPGSLRGLSRVRGFGTASTWRKDAFIPELLKLRQELKPMIGAEMAASICLQDLQNCLCEFDKYERVRLGQGKPRSSYTQRA